MSRWRAACWVDTNEKEFWYVTDDSDDPQPVAIVPRGREVAEEIAELHNSSILIQFD